jgi:iron-sulfur cluster repair protein YtfE (RIC family)
MAGACTCGCGHHEGTRATTVPGVRYTAQTPVGDIGREPAALAVLERFGVNHCCGAHLSLREGAAAAGASLDDLLLALNAPTPVTP